MGRYDRDASKDLLLASLGDPDGVVRGRAIRALAFGDTAAVQEQAVRLIMTDPSFYVQQEALSVYDPSVASQGTALLVDRIAHGGAAGVRLAAAERLLRKPDAAGLDALESMTAEKETRATRTTALNILARWPDKTRAIAVATKTPQSSPPTSRRRGSGS